MKTAMLSIVAILAIGFSSMPANAGIYIDQPVLHGSGGTGDDTVPPGVSGLTWCHIVSTVSFAEILGFLTANLLTIGQLPVNIRTPMLGSVQTYAGLDPTMCAAAIAAGAMPMRTTTVRSAGFDATGTSPYYEP